MMTTAAAAATNAMMAAAAQPPANSLLVTFQLLELRAHGIGHQIYFNDATTRETRDEMTKLDATAATARGSKYGKMIKSGQL